MCPLLTKLSHNYIVFPRDLRQQITTKTLFAEIANFPNCLGAIDGTLIPIINPHENEYTYVCRKGYHAINVQAICNAKLEFTNVVCKWPGSTHDSHIWNNCTLATEFGNGTFGDSWLILIGDSGYPL